MEGNYRPTHSANSTNYNSAPADMDGANTAPFTISYDQANLNSPQIPQQSYSQAGNFAYNSSYPPASFSPAPVGPQFSYATSNASYSGSNTNAGSRVADVVRNIDTDQIASNIESGIGYVADKAGEFTATAKDKLANPNRRKALAIMGGAVASLALAMSLGSAVLNKTNSHSYDQTPAATSNNSSVESNQTEEVKDTDPNMNVETADSEHDGKISYKVYKMYFPPNGSNGQYVLDHEGEVSTQYDDNDSLDARKEITGNDLLDRATGKINADGSLDSVLESNHRVVRDALKGLLGEYGDSLNKKYRDSYRANNGKDVYSEPSADSFDDAAYVMIDYDLSKYLPDIRDYRRCKVLYKIVNSSAKYTVHFGQRFQWSIGAASKYYTGSGYVNIYESDSLPTVKQIIEIIKKERKDTRNNENNSTDDGFITIYNRS